MNELKWNKCIFHSSDEININLKITLRCLSGLWMHVALNILYKINSKFSCEGQNIIFV